jgi:hypothetical protein
MTKDLPEWFVYPRHLEGWQESLFKKDLTDVLVRLGVSHDDLNRWHDKGWVSFDSSPGLDIDDFDGPHIREVAFVRDVVRSGLSDAQIEHLLSLLPKPFTFNPSRVSFSFMYGWVESVPGKSSDDVIEEHLESWLEDLAQSGDTERLRELSGRIEELLGETEAETDKDEQ